MDKNIKISHHFFKTLIFFWFFIGFSQLLIAQDTDKEYVFNVCDAVNRPDMQTYNLDVDSSASLPIGIVKEIGGVKYIIAIDSAEFLPNGAYFNAYMALEFPGAQERIAFAANHIKFNPLGVTGGEQAKLMLVSEHNIKLGPKNVLHLPADGSNYIEWDCNGYKSVNLHGDFVLDSAKLIALSPTNGDSTVKADFEIHVSDLHDVMAAVNITPFRVEGLDDFEFTINEAYVDLSDYNNPPQFSFPQGYPNQDEDINLWRGFFLKGFSVKLPNKLAKKSGQSSTIYGQNMLIDDAGISGKFGATNVFSTSDGAIASWSFSVDDINVTLVASNLTGGGMSGKIGVPALDNNELAYGAVINYNPNTKKTDYVFNMALEQDDTTTMSALHSTLIVKSSSNLNMTLDAQGHFKPTLILNGSITTDFENLNLNQLSYENVTFITEAPYLTQGTFSLTSSPSNKVGKYPVSLQSVTLGLLDGQATLGVAAGLNLGSGTNGFSVEGSCTMKMHIEKDVTTNEENWEFDSFHLNTIAVDIHTSAFGFTGAINFRDDDPVYGKGFAGQFSLKMAFLEKDNSIPEISMACIFGKVNSYKYWMVDSKVSGISIALTPSVPPAASIISLAGGVAYHMRNPMTAADMIEAAKEGGSVPPGTQMTDYIPDNSYGYTFRAGVGIDGKSEEAFNADMYFQVTLNANGGLSDIQFNGTAYMLCKRAERLNATNYIKGNVSIVYDNQQQIFDLNADVVLNFSNVVTGTAWTKLYISPSLWYLWVGKPDNRVNASIYNLATANAYFMLGMNLPPMPPPPPQVAVVASGMSPQRNETLISGGNGVAAGASVNVSFSSGDIWLGSNHKRYIKGAGYAGLGFDMTMLKYPTTSHCSGSSGAFGMNYWYLNGQLYAYLGFDLSYVKLKNDGSIKHTYTVAHMDASLILQGKLPKPTYVNGTANLNVVVCQIINVNISKNVEIGTNCTIVN